MPTSNQLRATLRKRARRAERKIEDQRVATKLGITVEELRARRVRERLEILANHEAISRNYFREPTQSRFYNWQ